MRFGVDRLLCMLVGVGKIDLVQETKPGKAGMAVLGFWICEDTAVVGPLGLLVPRLLHVEFAQAEVRTREVAIELNRAEIGKLGRLVLAEVVHIQGTQAKVGICEFGIELDGAKVGALGLLVSAEVVLVQLAQLVVGECRARVELDGAKVCALAVVMSA